MASTTKLGETRDASKANRFQNPRSTACIRLPPGLLPSLRFITSHSVFQSTLRRLEIILTP
jgi:hypothetical protein